MNYVVCPCCTINVGFLSCPTCAQPFEFKVVEEVEANCTKCPNENQLKAYIQMDHDKHTQCWRSCQRKFYLCQCCDGHYCPCVLRKNQFDSHVYQAFKDGNRLQVTIPNR